MKSPRAGMDVKNKLVVALDVTPARAKEIVSRTRDLAGIYKVGPVLWLEWGSECLKFFAGEGARVMIDFKFHDIPNTVKASLAALLRAPGSESIWGVTLHTLGGYAMLTTAVSERDAAAHRPMLFGVTVLTSLREKDLYRVGINRTVEAEVKKLAVLAEDAGLDGVVCSGDETAVIRKACGREFLTLVPGVRLDANPKKDLDQKRVVTPAAALAGGADYLIVGRDIYEAEDPRERLEALLGAAATAER
ncbi:MAG: orotidine-5'-phosphate decarboxylase [Elusimicrobia bacterium]|nr:orotidine-5'-phosphate decarboxylase [Elusimicrobiota bacterium]